MKNKKNIIVFFILILITVIMPNEVLAADKKTLANCKYTLDNDKLSKELLYKSHIEEGKLEKITLDVTVYDDGSIGKKSMYVYFNSTKKEVKVKDLESVVIAGAKQINFDYESKIFNKNGIFYKKYKEKNTCPDLAFYYYDQTSQQNLNIKVYDEGDTFDYGTGGQGTQVSAKVTQGESGTIAKKKYYCEDPRIKPVRDWGDGAKVKITTYEINGKKEFEIEWENNGVKEVRTGTSTNGAVLGPNGNEKIFAFDQKDIDLYWSDKCPKTEMYFLQESATHGITITSTRPKDVFQNGSYDWKDAADDNGFDQLVDITIEDSPMDCEGIFNFEEGGTGWIIQKILNYIRIIGPILVVILSSVDFIQAVFSSDEKAMKKAQSKLITRLICAIVLFLIPTLVNLALHLINGISDPNCGFY